MKLNNSMLNKAKFIKDTFENRNVTDVISQDVKEFGAKMRTSKPLEPLEEDIVEISERDIAELKDDSVPFEDFDDFFRMSELEEYGEQSEFYNELQYSIDDVPIADSINPNKNMILNTQMHTHYLDTDLDYNNVFKLKLMDYHAAVLSASGSNADYDAVREMAYKAAYLEDRCPKGRLYEYIGKSILHHKNEPDYPSSDLLDFVVKRPYYRNDVVLIDKKGNETYSRCFGSHFDTLLNETKDVKTIKRVLSDCSLRFSGEDNYFDWQFADFGVELFKKNKTWGEKEVNLVNSLKDICINSDSHILYETVNKPKLRQAKELLRQDTDIEDIIKQVSENKVS